MEGPGSGNWTFQHQLQAVSGMIDNYTTVTDNDTASQLTCEQRQLEFGSPLPIPMNIANVLRYIQAVYYLINLMFGLPLNLFVTVLILRFKKLRNVTFILALQVCAGNVINAAIIFPTSATNAIVGHYVFTNLCSTLGFAIFFLNSARYYLMFVLTLDRFYTVIFPFWYERNRINVVLPFSLGAWILAFIIALIPVRGLLDCYAVRRNSWICFPEDGCIHQGECFTYKWINLTLANVVGVVSLVMYLVLFCKARKLRNKVAIAHQPSTSSEAEVQERMAAAENLKRERRANITFFLLFLALIGVSVPPSFFVLVGRVIAFIAGTALPTAYNIAEILIGSTVTLLIIIDPIVIMRNEDFREVSRKFLKRIQCKS